MESKTSRLGLHNPTLPTLVCLLDIRLANVVFFSPHTRAHTYTQARGQLSICWYVVFCCSEAGLQKEESAVG